MATWDECQKGQKAASFPKWMGQNCCCENSNQDSSGQGEDEVPETPGKGAKAEMLGLGLKIFLQCDTGNLEGWETGFPTVSWS